MSLKMPNFPLKVGEVVNEKITKKNDIIKVEENNTQQTQTTQQQQLQPIFFSNDGNCLKFVNRYKQKTNSQFAQLFRNHFNHQTEMNLTKFRPLITQILNIIFIFLHGKFNQPMTKELTKKILQEIYHNSPLLITIQKQELKKLQKLLMKQEIASVIPQLHQKYKHKERKIGRSNKKQHVQLFLLKKLNGEMEFNLQMRGSYFGVGFNNFLKSLAKSNRSVFKEQDVCLKCLIRLFKKKIGPKSTLIHTTTCHDYKISQAFKKFIYSFKIEIRPLPAYPFCVNFEKIQQKMARKIA